KVEEPPHEVAVPGLALLDERPVHRARPDGDTRSLVERPLELLKLLDGSGEVGVREQHSRTTRSEHATTNAGTLAEVLGIAEHAPALAEPGQDRSRGLCRTVGRTVVDNEHLEVAAPSFGILEDALERRREAADLVVGGDHDGCSDAGHVRHLDSW